MPVVRITIREGKSAEYRKALRDGVHNALVRSFRIPEHDRFQTLVELGRDRFEAPPAKSDNVTLIEVTAFKGRSIEAKRRLYQTIAANLAEAPGIAGNDIIIVLHEPPLENWGIRGGKPASEVDLGFKVEV